MGFDLSKLKSFLKQDISKDASSESILGIDIGSSAIKFIQIHSVKGVPTLETYGELQLGPDEGIEIGRITNVAIKKRTEALIDILREGSATTKNTVYSLSYGSSFTSTILIPTLDQEQIAAMVPVEARKYIPISLSKVTLDWVPLCIHQKEKVTNVLLSAVYNEAREQYETIMNECGLSVLTNEIEIFSTIRSTVSQEDESVAIIDLGASATRLYIVDKGVIKKTHSIPLSGLELTRELSEELSIEFIEAEELKRKIGLLVSPDNPSVQKILTKTLERGVRELHTVVRRYGENYKITLQKVILSGGGALMPGIVPYISDTFLMPVELADSFSKVAYPAFLEDTLAYAGATFSVAIGLALRGFQSMK